MYKSANNPTTQQYPNSTVIP